MGIYAKHWGIAVRKSDAMRGNYIERLKLPAMTRAQAEKAIKESSTSESLVLINMDAI